jgi:hypothetical protein
MHLPTRLALAAALSIGASAALAQDNAVVLSDARHKTVFCVVPDINKIVVPPVAPTTKPTTIVNTGTITEQSPCGELTGDTGFLVQGQRNQLRVINRRFLTRYAFFVDKVTPVQNFPIEDLNEAANLTTPIPSSTAAVSKGAAPKGLATSGALTLRNAQDLISELLNPATSSNPVNEIASDWLVVKREMENVRNDATAFKAVWDAIFAAVPGSHPCVPAYAAPTLISANACLAELNRLERSDHFDDSQVPFHDEDGFRKLVVNDNDAIAMVTLLGSILTQRTPLLANQLSAFDGDLAALRADMNTLAGNVQAILDAKDLLGSMGPEMTKAQIKLRLIQTLNGGTKPVLDDAEVNRLTEYYFAFIRKGMGKQELERAKDAIDLVLADATIQAQKELKLPMTLATPALSNVVNCPLVADMTGLGCYAREIGLRYSHVLEEDHAHLNVDLPTWIAEINTEQSNLLARANEIYDESQVAVALDRPIDLGGQTGNLRVYFTIYETETFPRFAMPLSSSSPVVAATPVTIANPTPPPAASTPATPPQPSGNPVTSGMIEVHDRYRATMVAAFAFSPGVKEISIRTSSITAGTATGGAACSTTTPCTQVLTAGPVHSSVILGMSFHPGGYDTFPGAFSWKKPGQALKQALGIFGGLSVQNLNDYYFGADIQVAHGLQFMGGLNFYRQTGLAAGFTSGGIYPGTPNFTGPQQWTHGGYFGLGLNLSIFRKAFGSVTGLGTKTTSSGN